MTETITADSGTAIASIGFADLPALGAPLEGGRFCGVTTLKDGSHRAVILLPDKAPERMPWNKATVWAEEAGGQLPSRQVAALLYANVKDELQKTWHWTSDTLDQDTGDEDDASYAWICGFSYGDQYDNPKSYEGSAVAVRLIPLTA